MRTRRLLLNGTGITVLLIRAKSKAFGQSCRLPNLLVAVLGALALCGCSFPPVLGTPVHKIPPELLGESRTEKKFIDLSRLRQAPPKHYLLGPNDILGIFIQGVLGNEQNLPPVQLSTKEDTPPAIGYPIPIRDDGTISLPLIAPLKLSGFTLREAEDAIRKAYTVDQKILREGRDRIIVTLMKRRTYQVMVIREDSRESFASGGGRGAIVLSGNRRGSAVVLNLPAYENDLLHALTESGGLPGLDAENEVQIRRGAFKEADDGDRVMREFEREVTAPGSDSPSPPPRKQIEQQSFEESLRPVVRDGDLIGEHHGDHDAGYIEAHESCEVVRVPFLVEPSEGTEITEDSRKDRNLTRIPLRLAPGEEPTFTEKDILLNTGDVIFIESRDADVFYTGGLLRGQELPLPRDYDLDVLAAVALAGGEVPGGNINLAALASANGIRIAPSGNGSVVVPATQAIVIRRMKGGGQVAIRVSLHRALRDPRERILIQPGDMVLVRYSMLDSLANGIFLTFPYQEAWSQFVLLPLMGQQ